MDDRTRKLGIQLVRRFPANGPHLPAMVTLRWITYGFFMVCAVAGLTGPGIAAADPGAPLKGKKPTKLFQSHQVLGLEIRGPFSEIFSNRKGERLDYPGTLVLVEGAKRTVLDISLSLRGNNRAARDICRFPPLKIGFNKDQVKKTVFAKQKTLKLVTHCQNHSNRSQQYYLNEYMLYRAYNALTDQSFGVRLADITYVRAASGKVEAKAYGFFLERISDVARRTNLQRARLQTASAAALNPTAMNTYALFQYMIGNLDWSVEANDQDKECCHNTRLLTAADGTYIPVPYDFDQSGAVNTDYAYTYSLYKLRHSKARLYRGFCSHAAGLDETVSLFQARRAAIDTMQSEIPVTHKREQGKVQPYLDSFYKIIADPHQMQKQILEACR
jgi:hypothetical protein